MNLNDIVAISAVRTPMGAFGGTLKDLHSCKLGSFAVKAGYEKIGLTPDLIDDVITSNQLIRCNHCHLLATYFRNKKFCSKATDGRNCFGRHHSKQDYLRHKGKRLPVKRAWIKKARREIPGY